jgi:hypothetical protein
MNVAGPQVGVGLQQASAETSMEAPRVRCERVIIWVYAHPIPTTVTVVKLAPVAQLAQQVQPAHRPAPLQRWQAAAKNNAAVADEMACCPTWSDPSAISNHMETR